MYQFLLKTGLIPQIVEDWLYEGKTKTHIATSHSSQIKGAFTPFENMWNDFMDTFTPYRSLTGLKKDIVQPIKGIKNILKGILHLLAIIPLLGVNIIRYAATSEDFSMFMDNMTIASSRLFSWSLYGLFNIFRGITQLAATPLTYFIKAPIRIGIWLYSTFFSPDNLLAQNRREIQNLADDAVENYLDHENERALDMIKEIHKKFRRGVDERNEDTYKHDDSKMSDPHKVYLSSMENEVYEKMSGLRVNHKSFKEYLSLFSNKRIPDVKGVAIEYRMQRRY